jgi:superfamily II DNA/RNA helicase
MDTTMTPGTDPTMTPGMGTTGMMADFEEVADNPNQFMGQMVTLNGEVAEVLGPNVFRIQEDQLIGGSDIIVITTDGQMPVMEDSQVQVTGEVRQLVITEIERDYDLGWDDTFSTEIEREYTDRPAIVAQSIQPMMTNP